MRLTYRGNGSTWGSVPVDLTDYNAGQYATIKAPGTMAKDGFVFAGWSASPATKRITP